MIKPYFQTEIGKLYCGDSYEIMKSLDLSKYAILTDPNYGENQNLKRAIEDLAYPKRISNRMILKRKDWPDINDSKPSDVKPFLSFKQVIIWGGNYFDLPASRCWIIWDKMHNPPDNHHDCEMAWTNLPGVTRIHHQLWRGVCREGEENIVNGPKLHPFQKPIRLFSFCIGQLKGKPPIFDPFAGSGTTPAICERIGRPWLAIEIKEEFCSTIKNRVSEIAKQKNLFNY